MSLTNLEGFEAAGSRRGSENRIIEDDTMLVLTRKLMERLYIGDEICVTVVRLEGGQVRLGIEAPREISVVRAELLPEGRGHLNGSAGTGRLRTLQPEDQSVADAPILPSVGVRSTAVPGLGSRLRGSTR